jgi:CRP/FNR family transcriptional regulator, cyclic AMP receptor protein
VEILPVEDKLRSLSLVDIFAPLSTEELERLNEQLSNVHLERDEIFYTPEDPSEKIFVLQTGRVRIYKVVDDREFTLDVVGAGTVFGEMALTARRLRGAYAQAMTSSEIAILSRDQLERLILEKPEVGLQIVHLLSERLRRYETRLGDVTLKDVVARLASLILSLIDSEAVVTRVNQLKIPNHYTHQQLGTMIGAKREAVTRAFARLQDEGAVELKRRLIYVTDVQALRRLARFTGHGDDGEEQTP